MAASKATIAETAKEIFHRFFHGMITKVEHLSAAQIKQLKDKAHEIAEIWHEESK